MDALQLEYRPHIEHAGFHTDRFDVLLDGEPVVGPTRSPLYAAARELIRRGFDPEQLMTIRLTGRGNDSFVPASIGELAKWTITEAKSGGLRRVPWRQVYIGSPGDDEEESDVRGS